MPIKKPGGLAPIATASISEKQSSMSMSDTGSLAMGGFNIGRHGITQSPLSVGEVSTLRLDQLTTHQQLGRGASSRVHLATHQPSGKPVAVKVLQPASGEDREARKMALNEVRMVFQARSDHLVAFYDAFHQEGSLHLVLEYMDAGSLEGLYMVSS